MTELESLGTDDPGSMAHKLARMEEGVGPEPKTEPEPEPSPEPESKPEPDKEAAPAELPGEEPPEPSTPPEDEIPEGWEFKPEYKDHQEAEKGAKEAKSKMHEATTLAAREKEAREKAEREAEELRQRMAELEAKPPEKPAEEAATLSKEERAARLKNVAKVARTKSLAKIRELDPYADDYDDQVAEAMAEADTEALLEAGLGASLPQDEIDKLIDRRIKAKEEAAAQAEAEKRRQEAEVRTWEKAVDLAKEAGLDMTIGTADYRLFRDMASELPEEFKDKTFNEQVRWAVGETRKLLGKAVQMTEAEREKARKAQEGNAVLERGNTRPKTPETTSKQRSMDEIISDLEAKEQQRRA